MEAYRVAKLPRVLSEPERNLEEVDRMRSFCYTESWPLGNRVRYICCVTQRQLVT